MRYFWDAIFGRRWLEAEKMGDWQTNSLFAVPSFLSGLARTFDVWGTFDVYNASRTPSEADAYALYSDWHIVGQHIRDAAISRSVEQPAEDRVPALH